MRRSVSSGSKRNDNGRRRSEPLREPRGKSNLPKRSPRLECGASLNLPYPPLRQKSRTASPEKRTLDLPMTHASTPSLPLKRVRHILGMTRLQARNKGAFINQRARARLPCVQLRLIASSLKMHAHALAGTASEAQLFLSHHSVPSFPPFMRTVGRQFHRCLKYFRYQFTQPFRLCL